MVGVGRKMLINEDDLLKTYNIYINGISTRGINGSSKSGTLVHQDYMTRSGLLQPGYYGKRSVS